jgi:predicted DNA-binding protein
MTSAKYTERLSVGFTPDQVHRLDEITRIRSRKGVPLTKADVVRDSVEFYLLHQEDLPGARKAIAKAVEGKVAQVEGKVVQIDAKLDRLDTKMSEFIRWVEARVRK